MVLYKFQGQELSLLLNDSQPLLIQSQNHMQEQQMEVFSLDYNFQALVQLWLKFNLLEFLLHFQFYSLDDAI